MEDCAKRVTATRIIEALIIASVTGGVALYGSTRVIEERNIAVERRQQEILTTVSSVSRKVNELGSQAGIVINQQRRQERALELLNNGFDDIKSRVIRLESSSARRGHGD